MSETLQKAVIKAIEPVHDPEIHLSVVDLGLIYGVIFDGSKVNVQMTLTTPMCPYGPQLREQVRQAAASVAGVTEAKVDLVWEPVWEPNSMCTDDAKFALGLAW